MHSGNAAAMPPARNEATLSFCHASRSVRITTAILGSNCMVDFSTVIPGWSAGPDPESLDSPMCNRTSRLGAPRRPGMTEVKSPLGVAGPGADHAFLAAEFIALARGFVERTRNPGLDGIAVGAAGIGHVDR